MRTDPFTLRLHPVGKRGFVLAAIVFLAVLPTRIVGLGTPRVMFFDETVYARSAVEYLEGKEPIESTHPPLSKLLIAFFVRQFSGFHVSRLSPMPAAARGDVTALDDEGRLVTASREGVRAVPLTTNCAIGTPHLIGDPPISPSAIASQGGLTIVGGTLSDAVGLAWLRTDAPLSFTPLASLPRRIAVLAGDAFVVTDDGVLSRVAERGSVSVLALGARDVRAVAEDSVMWASFPDERSVKAFDGRGAVRWAYTTSGRPGALAVPVTPSRGSVPHSMRIVAVDGSSRLESVNPYLGERPRDSLSGGADYLASTGAIVWAARGRELRAIEPLGLSTFSRLSTPGNVEGLFGDAPRGRAVGLTSDGVFCASAHPSMAWRGANAVFGSLGVALTLVVALRLFGSIRAALLAAALMALDGLSFVFSRMAGPDTFVTGFMLASWFSVLSALHTGARSRTATLGWLAACATALGLEIATKWIGVYTAVAILLALAWDIRARRVDGWVGAFRSRSRAVAACAALFVMLPAFVYLLAYFPYLAAGNSLADVMELQRGMLTYHRTAGAWHWMSSSWYWWPIAGKALLLDTVFAGQSRAELWAIANPVLLIGGLACILWLPVAARRRRDATGILVAFAAAAQYIPWLVVPRYLFLYHYLPVVPFLSTALAWRLSSIKSARARRASIALMLLATGLVFAVTLPMLDGWAVDPSYQRTVRSALSWLFPRAQILRDRAVGS